MKSQLIFLKDETKTQILATHLAKVIIPDLLIFLEGDLGAGKTTFMRSILQSLGHEGAVKSPTFTLVEEYQLNSLDIFHFDLYRLSHPEELEYMGIRDYFRKDSIVFIEWPEKGKGYLAEPDLTLKFDILTLGRNVTLFAHTLKGEKILSSLMSLDEKSI